jgi:hypothetical protein
VFATRGGYRLLDDSPDGLTWGREASDLLRKSDEWFPTNGYSPDPDRARWTSGDPLPTPVPNPTPEPAREETARSKQGQTVAEPISLDSLKHSIRQNSVLVQLLRPQRVHLNLSSFEWLLLREYPDEYWIQIAWPLAEKYLVQLQTVASAQGSPTVLMLIPHISQFIPRWTEDVRSRYGLREDQLDFDRPQREFKRIADAHRIPVLDLLPVFRAEPERDKLYFQRDTHLTPVGHREVASRLAAFVAAYAPGGRPR